MANPTILIANTVVTVLLTWMVLNHLQIVEHDPVDVAVNGFQRLVYYSQIDGSVTPPPETFMTVVSKITVIHVIISSSVTLFFNVVSSQR